jgi:hypothetical protein
VKVVARPVSFSVYEAAGQRPSRRWTPVARMICWMGGTRFGVKSETGVGREGVGVARRVPKQFVRSDE